MTLEDAAPDDLPAIAALTNRAYRPAADQAGWATKAAYIDGDRTTLALLSADLATSSDAHLLVVRNAGGAPDRCVWLEPHGSGAW